MACESEHATCHLCSNSNLSLLHHFPFPFPPSPSSSLLLARMTIRKNDDGVRHPLYATLLEREHLLSHLHGAPWLAVAIARAPCSVPKVSHFLLHLFPFSCLLTTFFAHTCIAHRAGTTSCTGLLYRRLLVRVFSFFFVSEFTLTFCTQWCCHIITTASTASTDQLDHDNEDNPADEHTR